MSLTSKCAYFLSFGSSQSQTPGRNEVHEKFTEINACEERGREQESLRRSLQPDTGLTSVRGRAPDRGIILRKSGSGHGKVLEPKLPIRGTFCLAEMALSYVPSALNFLPLLPHTFTYILYNPCLSYNTAQPGSLTACSSSGPWRPSPARLLLLLRP